MSFPSILTPGVTQRGQDGAFGAWHCSWPGEKAFMWWKWVGLGFPHTFHPAVKFVTTPRELKCQRSLQEGLQLFSASQIRVWFFSHFLCDCGQTLQLPARRAEKMWLQSSSKPSSALISEQEHSAPPLYFVFFTFEASLESQSQSRTGQWDCFIPTKKCWFSRSSRLCRAPYESLADEMSAGSPLKKQITYLGTANGILFPLLLSSSQEL